MLCAFVSGARSVTNHPRASLPCARAELENPTKRTVFSSYRQIGWSKTALKSPTAASFPRIRRWFQACVPSLAPVPRASAACIHTNSLIHPQRDRVLPLPDSNLTSFSSYPLLLSASHTRSVLLPPLSFTGQTVRECARAGVCVRCSMRATGSGVLKECKQETERPGGRERERAGGGGNWDRMIFFYSLAEVR